MILGQRTFVRGEDRFLERESAREIAHLAQSTPAGFHFQSSAFHDYHTVAIATGGPVVTGGFMQASDAPGLGVEPVMDVLGEPLFTT